jgi:hypothetical protein
MKLTTQQIDKLYTFTRQHYVEWYDLQSELVDHLANAIEQEWEQNPNRTFDEILNTEFKKFGIFGFMDVVEQKQKQLRRRYHSIIWSHFKDFFGFPKIVVTALSVLVVFSFLKQIQDPKTVIMSFYSFFLVVIFYKLFENKNQQKKENRKWLFKEIIFNYGSTNGIFLLLFHVLNSSIYDTINYLGNNLFNFLTATFLVSIAVIGFIVLILIPSKAEEYLIKTYPEYNFEKT